MGPEERNEKVTPLHERILALILEGVDDNEISSALGLAGDTLAGYREELRSALEVPDGVGLEEFARDKLPARPEEPPPQPSPRADERRIRILLRLTLKELMEVAGNAEMRAEMLRQTVSAIGSDDPGSAERESEDLVTVARELKEMMDRLLSDIRGRD